MWICVSETGVQGLSYDVKECFSTQKGGTGVDKALFMRACREGGAAIERALRELDRSFFAVLYRGGLRTLRDPDAARDLVQDTFIKVWQRCATFRGDSELLPWIKTILRHAAIERLRQPAREVPMEDHDGLTPDAAQRIAEISMERNPTPDQIAGQREQAEHFRQGWARFQQEDPLHANVMAWVVEDGLSIEDIAQLLERTPGATREFVSQCRKRARVYLAGWYRIAFEQGES
jgi:RNA polymerase sigma-70 factor (ECF subfamily)